MDKAVRIQRSIEQVQDGVKYAGHVRMAEVQFDYELEFATPLPELKPSITPMEVSELRNLYRISVKRNGQPIELSDGEYGYFFVLLIDFAVGFYESPQVRSINDGPIGLELRRGGSLFRFGATVSVGITDYIEAGFSPELCEVLSAPKFGCVFPA